MKTLKEIVSGKSGWILSTAIAVAASGFVFALDPPEPSYSRSEFKKENTDIRQDMKGITTSQERIAWLEAKLQRDRDANDRQAVIADRKNLKKAKADLKREKAYLRADKMDLKKDHNYAVCKSSADLRKEKRELREAKCELKKDLRKGNTAELHGDVNRIEKQQKEVDAATASLDKKMDNRKSELTAVNTELVNAGIRNELVIFKNDKTETAQAEKSKAELREAQVTASANDTRDTYPK